MISVVVPVYRNATSALELVAQLRRQRLPEGCKLEVVLVDDGSGDNTAHELAVAAAEASVVALPENVGRATARNAGAQRANGRLLVFIDCDCRPIDEHFLARQISCFTTDVVASCGPVLGGSSLFWERYQNDVAKRRQQRHEDGASWSGSSANLVVDRVAFGRLGGFDDRYRGYGFEDRDLLVRLATVGQISWCTEAAVQHVHAVTLPEVMRKMHAAAGDSAARFASNHPEIYRALGYAAIDARLHPWLRPLCILFGPCLRIAPFIEQLLAGRRIPYSVGKFVVKLLSALAYARGSAEKARPAG